MACAYPSPHKAIAWGSLCVSFSASWTACCNWNGGKMSTYDIKNYVLVWLSRYFAPKGRKPKNKAGQRSRNKNQSDTIRTHTFFKASSKFFFDRADIAETNNIVALEGIGVEPLASGAEASSSINCIGPVRSFGSSISFLACPCCAILIFKFELAKGKTRWRKSLSKSGGSTAKRTPSITPGEDPNTSTVPRYE